jgi:hypothetical protein
VDLDDAKKLPGREGFATFHTPYRDVSR